MQKRRMPHVCWMRGESVERNLATGCAVAVAVIVATEEGGEEEVVEDGEEQGGETPVLAAGLPRPFLFTASFFFAAAVIIDRVRVGS